MTAKSHFFTRQVCRFEANSLELSTGYQSGRIPGVSALIPIIRRPKHRKPLGSVKNATRPGPTETYRRVNDGESLVRSHAGRTHGAGSAHQRTHRNRDQSGHKRDAGARATESVVSEPT